MVHRCLRSKWRTEHDDAHPALVSRRLFWPRVSAYRSVCGTNHGRGLYLSNGAFAFLREPYERMCCTISYFIARNAPKRVSVERTWDTTQQRRSNSAVPIRRYSIPLNIDWLSMPYTVHRVEWRHSNKMLWGNMAYCVELHGKDLSQVSDHGTFS